MMAFLLQTLPFSLQFYRLEKKALIRIIGSLSIYENMLSRKIKCIFKRDYLDAEYFFDLVSVSLNSKITKTKNVTLKKLFN